MFPSFVVPTLIPLHFAPRHSVDVSKHLFRFFPPRHLVARRRPTGAGCGDNVRIWRVWSSAAPLLTCVWTRATTTATAAHGSSTAATLAAKLLSLD
ncbi:hypothetical protein ACA910_020823 [Epithemia clementina (nom. ined.)]